MRSSCGIRAWPESVAALSRLREIHNLQTTGVAKMRGMSSTEAPALDVILRDGTTLRLRPPSAADGDALVTFFARLSERSLYLRFHGARRIGSELAEPFLDPDWDDRGALIGTQARADGERVVALASYSRLRDPAVAEVAFAVADDLQGRGVGTRLLERLADR